MTEVGSGGRAVDARTATPDVFVSYASQDATVANTIVQNLETQGLRCWMAPRDVRPGVVYADAIVRAINETKALVLALSADAMASSHVGREVERAAAKKKHIIAFRIDAAPLSRELEYFLSNSQWIDVPTLGMHAALVQLNEAVGQDSAPSSQELVVGRHDGRARKRTAIAAAVVILVGVAVVLGLQYWSVSHQAAQPAAIATTDKSIAVLPFVDMSEKHDQEYFGDGVAEEILDLLAKVPQLEVIARTSSFSFKGKSDDIPTIAGKLHVAHILEGSVRKSGKRLRVTTQLIRASTGVHMWSETYDRDLNDIFTVQDEIASAGVAALKLQLLPSQPLVSTHRTANQEAYAHYLRGLQLVRRDTHDDDRHAAD